jgi:DNA-binding response OmpR family regulator
MSAVKNTKRSKTSDTKAAKPKRTVLIIDDEAALQDIYRTVFSGSGWTVYSADNGEDGLKMAETKQPGVILLDLVMPVKDGFEALRCLKSQDSTKDIPVVIFSNLGQDFEVKLGKSLGADAFLVKAEIEPAKLVERITDILDGRGGR